LLEIYKLYRYGLTPEQIINKRESIKDLTAWTRAGNSAELHCQPVM
jgi:hypothetical protein